MKPKLGKMIRYNPPGKHSLSYRAGTYSDFVLRMEWLVHRPELPLADGEFVNPLKNLDLNRTNDMAASLLKCWAVVGDILTFYQERIANEGYINTAHEQKSILELTRTIGYSLKPSLTASTFLAFILTSYFSC